MSVQVKPPYPEYEMKSSAFPRSNNWSMKKVSAKYFTMICNTKLKVTGLLTEAGNRKDSWLSSFNLL